MGGKSSNEPAAPYTGPAVGMYQEPEAEPFQFPEFPVYEGPSSEEYSAQLAEAEAQRQETQGFNDRDALYSDYISAAGSATDYINAQVTDERANAALLGIDYALTDEDKGTRISDYFASIWGAGDQSRLEGLIGKWGKPQGFEGYAVARGDGSVYSGETEKGPDKVKDTTGRPTLVDPNETDENQLGGASILGG